MKLAKFERRSTKNIESFVTDFLASTDQGMTTLLVKSRSDGIRVLRCDYSINITRRHRVGRSHYLPWMDEITYYAKSRDELFYTPNTFYGKRATDNLCSIRALYLDVDCHDKSNFNLSAIPYLVEYLKKCLTTNGLPVPTFVFSGRGIHLLWKIESVGPQLLPLWNAVQKELADFITSALEDSALAGIWDVDTQSLDVARVLRMPSTYNNKAERWCQFVSYSEETSKLKDFSEFFDVSTYTVVYAKFANCPVSRHDGLIRLADMRGWNLEGFRNTFMTILSSDMVVNGAGYGEVFNELEAVNKRFGHPLSSCQVRAIAKCSVNHGYMYSRSTIIDRLDLTNGEENLIISSFYSKDYDPVQASRKAFALYQATGVDTRIKHRHAKEEAEWKKRKKVDEYIRMGKLREEGKTRNEIADMLNVSKRTVSQYWKLKPEEIEAQFFPNGEIYIDSANNCRKKHVVEVKKSKKKPGKKSSSNSKKESASNAEPIPDPAPVVEPDTNTDSKSSEPAKDFFPCVIAPMSNDHGSENMNFYYRNLSIDDGDKQDVISNPLDLPQGILSVHDPTEPCTAPPIHKARGSPPERVGRGGVAKSLPII